MRIVKGLFVLFIALLASDGGAATYRNPQIDSVLTFANSDDGQDIAPNVFFTLDNSGSMRYTSGNNAVGRMPYDADKSYPVPPNPDTLTSFSIDEMTGNQNGFEQFGFSRGNGFYRACRNETEQCKSFNTFYASRMMALQSSLATALVEEQPNIRIGYQVLNSQDDNEQAQSLFPLLPLDPNAEQYADNMKTFLDWLYRRQADGWTPLRSAVTAVKESLYQNGTLKSQVLDGEQCRQTFSVVLSDGAYVDVNAYRPPAGDFDGQEHQWLLENSSGETVPTVFKGDGSQVEQRLFAGGLNSTFVANSKANTAEITDTPDYPLGGGLSDIALDQWSTDLDGDASNNILPPYYAEPDAGSKAELWNPHNDPANWQRIVTYTIGLGVGKAWDSQDLAAVTSGNEVIFSPDGSPSWPWAFDRGADSDGRSQRHIQDFIRAGYVGRGGFYRVDSPIDLQNVFKTIFKDIETRTTPTQQSGGSVSQAQVSSSSNSMILTTKSDYDHRVGTVYGAWLYNGVATTSEGDVGQLGDGNNCFGGSVPDGAFVGQVCSASGTQWSAADKLPSWEKRHIFTLNKDRNVGVIFDGEQLDEASREVISNLASEVALYGDSAVSDVVNYLKGDKSQESLTSIRTRNAPSAELAMGGEGLLGDIGHSTPIFVGNPDNRVWKQSPTPTRQSMVYVGGNDGMLHAFNAQTGVEQFAYFPNLLLSKVGDLVKNGQPHQAFVDGQIAVQDIVNPTNSERMTLLVAGLGAGGKGLFALNVANPQSFSEKEVLWELNDSRLGKVLGKPSIIRVEGHFQGQEDRWVVVVGTGYGNGSESGILVIDAISGEVLSFLALPNAEGVGEIAWIDHQKYTTLTDRRATYLDYSATASQLTNAISGYVGEKDRGYVGDLQGNLWLLDFAYDKANSDGTILRSGLSVNGVPEPLFVATDNEGLAQPITSGVITAPHPSGRGTMVYFGTGDMFSSSPLSNAQNSLYGIWDDFAVNYGDLSTADVETYNKKQTRSRLKYYSWQQSVGNFVGGESTAYRWLDEPITAIQWANTGHNGEAKENGTPAAGWVLDAGKDERVSQKPYAIVNNKGEVGLAFLLYAVNQDNTLDASNTCVGVPTTLTTWTMAVRTDMIDGPAAPFSVEHSDNNQDGNIDSNDAVLQGQTSLIPLGAINLQKNTAAGEEGMLSSPIVTAALGVSSGACAGGDIRTYKTVNEDSSFAEVKICISRTASAWSEIE